MQLSFYQNTKIFTFGDGMVYGKYKNEPLEKGKSYEVFQCGTTGEIEVLYGGVAKIAEGTVLLTDDDDGTMEQSEEKEKCNAQRHLYIILAVIVAVLLVIIVLLLIYIRHLRNKVKELSTKRNYEENSRVEAVVFENVAFNENPAYEEMSDFTSNVSPEYEPVDANPGPLQTGINQFQRTSKSKSPSTVASTPDSDDNNSTRPSPIVFLPNIQQHHTHQPMSAQGSDSSSGNAESYMNLPPNTESGSSETSYMNNPPQGTIPSPSGVGSLQNANKRGKLSKHLKPSPSQLNNAQSSVKSRSEGEKSSIKPQHTLPPPLPNSDTSTSFNKEKSGAYQPLGPRQQIQDSIYEELNDSTMSKAPSSEGHLDYRAVYQPLKKEVANSTYEHLRLAERSTDIQI